MIMQKIMRNGGRRGIPLLRKMQSYRGLSGCAIALASRATVISEVYIPSPIQVSMRNHMLSWGYIWMQGGHLEDSGVAFEVLWV